MAKRAKQITENDNVAMLLSDCRAGEEVTVKLGDNTYTYQCNQDTPYGHKIALCDIEAEGAVIKYGETIGSATRTIKKGDWVHVHNVRDDYLCLDKDGRPLPGQDKIGEGIKKADAPD